MISKRIKNISFGDILYYIGTMCDESTCRNYDERCYINCEHFKTKVPKPFVVNQMRMDHQGKVLIGHAESLEGYRSDDIFFDIKEKHEKFFFSKEEAENYLTRGQKG